MHQIILTNYLYVQTRSISASLNLQMFHAVFNYVSSSNKRWLTAADLSLWVVWPSMLHNSEHCCSFHHRYWNIMDFAIISSGNHPHLSCIRELPSTLLCWINVPAYKQLGAVQVCNPIKNCFLSVYFMWQINILNVTVLWDFSRQKYFLNSL